MPAPLESRRTSAVPRLDPALALVPLRLFLGATFVYAGVQKLADPGFLHPGAPTYIGTQLRGFADGTPGGFLLRSFALPHPQLAGVSVALLEIAIGLLVVLGLATRIAAAGGLVLNLVLFLTNSWKTYPYFLGSDIVFVFAWLPLALAGAERQPALDHELERLAARRARRRTARRERYARRGLPVEPGGAGEQAITRRAALGGALGATGAATLALGGIAALAKGPYRSRIRALGASRGPSAAPAAGHHPAARSAGPALPRGAVRLGPASSVARGQAVSYRDPASGGTDVLIRQADGGLSAFSAICTHAGCPVDYQGGKLVCPCHASVFNARTGAVEAGPAPTPLPARHVVEHGGDLYALPA